MTSSGKAWRRKYMYLRNELTNAPLAYVAEYSRPKIVSNYFTRDVDGTFMGEWGDVYNYIGSGWAVSNFYWSAEAWSSAFRFYIYETGGVYSTSPYITNAVAMCRGDY